MAGLYLQVEVLELDDDRLIEAGMEGRGVYLTVGLLAKRTETDGWVGAGQLRKEGATADTVTRLVEIGALEIGEDGRVRQVGWLDRNPSQAAIDQQRQAKADAGKRGNHDRWNHPGPVESCPKCHVVAPCDPTPIAPPNPVGSPDTESKSKSETEASTPLIASENHSDRPPTIRSADDVEQTVRKSLAIYARTKTAATPNVGDPDGYAAKIRANALTDGTVDDLRQLVESGMTAEDAAAARSDALFGVVGTAGTPVASEDELRAQREKAEASRLAMLAKSEAEQAAPKGDHRAGAAAAHAALASGRSGDGVAS